ncbi:MAG TPA: ATP-binding protein [Gemmatimonadales bacterium]|nr:ATP-binding protein [Gemmatimonadales bacterium]
MNRTVRWGAALALVALATLLRWPLTPWVGTELPFLTYYPAVFLAAWMLGVGPTLLTVAASAAVIDYLFIGAPRQLAFDDPVALVGTGIFAVVGTGLAHLGDRAERARRRAEAAAERAGRAAAEAERAGAEQARLGGALEAERARLAAVLRQMPAGVLLRDAEGRLLEANAEAERLFGDAVPADSGPGAPLYARLRHPDGSPVRFEELPATRARLYGETVRGTELLIDRCDGTTLHVSVGAAPVRDAAGAIVAVVVTFLDLTARRAAEGALRESRERLEFALEAGHMGTFDWLIPEGVVHWSPTLERMHGYPPGGFAGTAEAYFAEIHPEDRERVGAMVAAVFAGTREHHMEYRIVRPDGTSLWVEGRGRLLRDAAGRPLRLVGVCTDINDRRLAEEAARRSQRLEAMGQLAAGIAHDTNNMMAAVLGYAHLLHRAKDLPARRQREVQEIIKAAERTANLTQQLLAFSRRQLVTPEVLELDAAVADTEDMLRRTLGPRVALELAPGAAGGWVTFDRTQLVQVLLNLALNARDAMPEGGRLRLTTAHAPADGAGPRLVLAVRDTGAGMDDATRQRIFEPFFTTKEAGKGTGLGLSTVHGIVTQAGGTIDVESGVGAGTTFRITLPAAPAPTGAVSAAPVAPPAARARVLLVDDEEIVRELATRMLEEEGCAVTAAASGEAALDVLRAGLDAGADFDALVTDLTMPGMTGRDLAARVRERWPRLPILFITGHHGASLDDLVGPHAAVLPKPFSPEALTGALGRLLGREVAVEA